MEREARLQLYAWAFAGIVALIFLLFWIIGIRWPNRTEVKVYVEPEFQEAFEEEASLKGFQKNYVFKYCKASEINQAELVITSNKDEANTSKDYKRINYSPLIFVMKSSKQTLDGMRNEQTGWLISENKIKGNEEDHINCNFLKLVDAVIAGENWASLGGPDKPIKIYCPDLKSEYGQLFQQFLEKIMTNGEEENDKNVKSRIDAFFKSPAVHQVKIEKFAESISEDELYVVLECDILKQLAASSDLYAISLIYPETTVIREVFFNCTNPKLEKILTRTDFSGGGIESQIADENLYRRNEDGNVARYTILYSYNIQEGIKTFN